MINEKAKDRAKITFGKKSIYDCIDDALDVVEESFEEPFFVIKMSKIYDGLKDKDEKAVAVGVVEVVKAMLTGKMQKKVLQMFMIILKEHSYDDYCNNALTIALIFGSFILSAFSARRFKRFTARVKFST